MRSGDGVVPAVGTPKNNGLGCGIVHRLGIVHQAGHDHSVVAVLVRLSYPVQEAR
jgi:hypothetical protein